MNGVLFLLSHRNPGKKEVHVKKSDYTEKGSNCEYAIHECTSTGIDNIVVEMIG